jgi:molybdate transport system substrate-binding protein
MFAAGFAAAVSLALPGPGSAAEVKVLSALALREVVNDLGPKFERASANRLTIQFGTVGEVVKRVKGGETADVLLLQRQAIDELAKDGKVAPGNVAPFANSNIVVVVRKGAPKPDISSPEALKRALLAAKSVTYGDPAAGGASSAHFAKVLERLGIEKEMKAKTLYSKAGGDTGVQVANGKAELGVNQLPTFVPTSGIEVLGPLPGDLQATQAFVIATMSGATEPAAAKAFASFLRTPDAAKVIRAKGLEPGS